MKTNDKILVLGAKGLVGSALVRELGLAGYDQILTPDRTQLNLLVQAEVQNYFSKNKPQHVFLAAAKVGGIHANSTYPADFIFQNLQIQNNVFDSCFQNKVEKLLVLGSSCIYPKRCPQPMKEEYLLTAPLEESNQWYAIAKIAGLKMAAAFRRQYGCQYFSVMPTNLYGENDNFHPENSHVVPGMIARMHKMIQQGEKKFEIWGSGRPRREFLYVDDMAKACLFVMKKFEMSTFPDWINIGTGEDVAIGELARMIGQKMGYQGEFVFNSQYPDGTPQKLLDVTQIHQLGWKHQVSLSEGLDKSIQFYEKMIRTNQVKR